jgi:hypothetical protein
MSDMTVREQRVRARAHELWEAAGKPDGDDLRFWHEAEAEIDAEDRSAGAVRPRPTRGSAPPSEPTREERIPGRIEPPIQRDDPAGPPAGTSGTTPPRR